MNCISYSLFGYQQSHENSLDFKSYLRGLAVNMRMAELLYPGWMVCLSVDYETLFSPYKDFIFSHADGKRLDWLVVKPEENNQMCMHMLRRMQPIFNGYDRVICRDTDSLLCLKERQAVEYWIRGGRICHVMTDSISHTVPIMGGMCGWMSKEFKAAVGAHTFNQLVELRPGHDFSRKGSDQEFLNSVVLPKVAHSMTEHYLLGMPQSFRGDCHHQVQDIDLGLPEEFRETNGYAFHIGASGFQMDATVKFLRQHEKKARTRYFEEIEKKFPDVFYWHL